MDNSILSTFLCANWAILNEFISFVTCKGWSWPWLMLCSEVCELVLIVKLVLTLHLCSVVLALLAPWLQVLEYELCS